MREIFFLQVGIGQRFCVYYPPKSSVERGAVLYIHPFAEEMNKSRRMAALQANVMAEAGYAVLQIDLFGCGDSSGDFGDASWSDWRSDILTAVAWLRTRTAAPLTLWGLRVGCLLAATVAVDLQERPNFIFWQPVISGMQFWKQFMRLKAASELASGRGKEVLDALRQRLDSGSNVEIAGYSIDHDLAYGLENAELVPVQGQQGSVGWFELSSRPDARIAPVALQRIEKWRSAGYVVDAVAVEGPAFWQTSEIEVVPQLIDSTLSLLGGWQ